MKIRIYIVNEPNDEISLDNNTLVFGFSSIETYKKAKQGISLTQEFYDDLQGSITLKDLIGDYNPQKLKKEFSKVKPIIKLSDYQKDIFNIDFPAIINLSYIPFAEKLSILTDPRNNGQNLFFQDEFTTGEYVSLEEMINMYQAILQDCDFISQKNYSEVEAIYYIYLKYKERIYSKEGKKERKAKSRSLNQIIKGDKIVCVGYANYLNAIASILGLKVAPLAWTDKESAFFGGHQENIAIINDPKYNLKGVFAIDITWDSKKDENDQNYSNKITHFLMPLAIDEREKECKGLILPNSPIYYNILDFYQRLNKLLELNAPENIIEIEKETLRKRINSINSALGIPNIPEKFDMNLEVEKIRQLGKQLIPLKTLENIIASVDPQSTDRLQETIMTSYHFLCAPPEHKLLYSIFGAR